MRPRVVAASVAAALALGTTAGAQVVTPTFSNVAYAANSPAQRLDIYLPPGPVVPRPVLVWIHGGGWQSGDKFPMTRAPGLLALGFDVVSINYRLTGEAIHPAQINDCKGAIRWIRANAGTYGFDPARIGVWGSSAGGHLVACLGTMGGVTTHEGVNLEGAVGGNLAFSSRVQAVVDHFGPTDFFNLDTSHTTATAPESLLVGFWIQETLNNINNPAFAARVSALESVSNVTFASSDDPPFLIAHGTADPVVPPSQSQTLSNVLTAAGVPNTLTFIEGAGHGLPPSEDLPARNFLVATLNVAPCPGDTNGDRAVNTVDLTAFLAGFGRTTAPGNPGDFDGSGVINTLDLSILLGNFGRSCGLP
jgi:acetyl esterase/lipase